MFYNSQCVKLEDNLNMLTTTFNYIAQFVHREDVLVVDFHFEFCKNLYFQSRHKGLMMTNVSYFY